MVTEIEKNVRLKPCFRNVSLYFFTAKLKVHFPLMCCVYKPHWSFQMSRKLGFANKTSSLLGHSNELSFSAVCVISAFYFYSRNVLV